ncbi:MAG TPA: hypothetical protein VK438_12025 [Xanthobacteraceae bacterium]|nr:hypothetical protein [Xanthobacteraceae bacterium]
MKMTVKRKGHKARGKTLKELARDTRRMVFGGPKKKKKTAKKAKKKAKKKKKA